MREYSTDPIWVGLDVHQSRVTAAVLHGDSEKAQVVNLPGEVNAVRKLMRRLSKDGAPRSCYEASGAGYVLQRALDRDGFHCEVIAPSLIPRKPGDRRKTDRLDAIRLVELYRGGYLSSVRVPDEDHEAVRQLVRTRLNVQRHITRVKHRVVKILSAQGHRFTGTKSNWTLRHRAWLEQMRRELEGPQQLVLSIHLEHLEYLETEQRSLDTEIERISRMEPWRASVEALKCFRGIKTLTAMTIVTEVGDIRRFRSPRGLMSYTGLVPSERSSGDVERRGPITKAGNAHLRRVLVEAAWHYHHRAKADQHLIRRRYGQKPEVVAIAVKAQHRLSKRFWRLKERKHHNKAVTAVARELCGFIWAAMNAVAQETEA
jgi:transposase